MKPFTAFSVVSLGSAILMSFSPASAKFVRGGAAGCTWMTSGGSVAEFDEGWINTGTAGSILGVQCALPDSDTFPSYGITSLTVDVDNFSPFTTYPEAQDCVWSYTGSGFACSGFIPATANGYQSISLSTAQFSLYPNDYMTVDVDVSMGDQFVGYYASQ
jgi:hypothetical protein